MRSQTAMQLLNKYLNTLHPDIETPALLVDTVRMDLNITRMQQIARENGIDLRPHCKTHKSVQIAKKQLQAGAIGITVAKLGEAEIMANAGIDNIFIANQITHPKKISRLFNLHRNCQISLGIDHPDQVKMLKQVFINPRNPLEVLIEIDCGFHRCGVTIGDTLAALALMIKKAPGLRLKGVFTHAGHVYGADDSTEVLRIGKSEGEYMQQVLSALAKMDISVNVISVGSTPTAPVAAKNPAVTEIRPGNYVFHDQIQVSLGACKDEDCALAVVATVIARPDVKRVIIDAGSKALNLDRGAHAVQKLSGFGRLANLRGEIVRLSEEHGIIELNNDQNVPVGAPVLIVPNHACAVSNLYDYFHFVDAQGKWHKVPIDARGRSD